jgi:hypothetical protein
VPDQIVADASRTAGLMRSLPLDGTRTGGGSSSDHPPSRVASVIRRHRGYDATSVCSSEGWTSVMELVHRTTELPFIQRASVGPDVRFQNLDRMLLRWYRAEEPMARRIGRSSR